MSQPNLTFEQFAPYFDPDCVFFPVSGNGIGSWEPMAIIKIRDLTEDEQRKVDSKRNKQLSEGKAMFDKYVKKGVRFQTLKDGKLGKVKSKITFVNTKHLNVSWKQYNLDEMNMPKETKPAAGKFTINGFLSLLRSKTLSIIE